MREPYPTDHGPFQADEIREEVETLRRSIVEVLMARDLAVDDDLQAAIESYRDVEVLTLWLRRAAIAVSSADVTEPGAI